MFGSRLLIFRVLRSCQAAALPATARQRGYDYPVNGQEITIRNYDPAQNGKRQALRGYRGGELFWTYDCGFSTALRVEVRTRVM